MADSDNENAHTNASSDQREGGNTANRELEAPPRGKATRATLAHAIGENLGLSQQLCNDVVVSFFDTIKRSLIAREPVKIQKFATFNLRNKKSRPGRNPKTGEEVEVSARRVISFRPSRKLRTLIESRDRNVEP